MKLFYYNKIKILVDVCLSVWNKSNVYFNDRILKPIFLENFDLEMIK